LVVEANEAIYHRINQYVGTVGKVSGALCLDALSPNLAYSYDYWMDKVAKEPAVPAAPVVASDIATIIYTSGTTGNPKGVELSHENLCANVDGNLVRMKEMFRPEMVGLGFLPWAHIFGQTCDLHCLFATGISMGIVEKREHILEGLQVRYNPCVLSPLPASPGPPQGPATAPTSLTILFPLFPTRSNPRSWSNRTSWRPSRCCSTASTTAS
jgi:long-chain acyl-CoA synthetase